MESAVLSRRMDLGLLVLRLGVAIILLFHGVDKLRNGIAWMEGPLGAVGLPGFVGYGVYVAEILAPLLLIFGVRTRLAAAVIVFDMVMAVVLVLRGQLFAVKENGGGWGLELEGLIMLGALALFFTGGGRYRVGGSPGRWD